MDRVNLLFVSFIAVLGGIAIFAAVFLTESIYIALIIPFILLFLVVIFCSLEWGLYTLIFIAPVMVIDFRFDNLINDMTNKWIANDPGSPEVYIMFVPAVVAGWIIKRISGKLPVSGDPMINGLLVGLLAWSFITMLWAPNPTFCLIQLSLFTFNVFMFFFTANVINDRERLEKVISAFIIVGFIFSVAAIGGFIFAQHEKLQDVAKKDFYLPIIKGILSLVIEFRIHPIRAGLLAHPSQTVCVVNIAVACLLYRVFRGQGRRSVNIVLLLLMVITVLLTQSKAGIAILLMIGIFFLILNKKTRVMVVSNSILWTVMIVSTFILIQITTQKTVLDRIEGTSSISALSEDSISTRIEWWKKGFRYLNTKSHWTGLGPGGFKYYMSRDRVPNAHGIYFSILFDMGIPGLALLLVIIISFIKRFYTILMSPGFELYEISIVFAIVLFIIGIHGIIDFEYNSQFLWPILGAATAVLVMAENELGVRNSRQVYRIDI